MYLTKIYYLFPKKKICKMQGVYKMRLATFYWEMNRSYNEQVVGEDLLAEILQNLEKTNRT